MINNKILNIGYFSILGALNVISMIIVYKYYIISDIPQRLLVAFAFDMSKYISIIIIEIMFVLFLIAEIVFLIAAIKNKNTKIAKIIIPIAFVIIVPLSISVPLMTAESAQLPLKDSQIGLFFDELKTRKTNVDTFSTYEKNSLGKVAYYEQKSDFEINGDNNLVTNNSSADFLCSYQQSDCKFIQNKFERYETKEYALKNKEYQDNFTIYYEKDSEHISYALIIERGNKYFVATFESLDNNEFDNYSKDDFISDSMTIYNLCDKI